MNVTWESLGLHPRLIEKLRENRIETPTPVQAAAIPELLAGRDISAKSQTGSGKTLAYLLPALQRTDADSTAVQTMVLAPTQELAMQIFRVAETYCEPLGIRVQQLIGGASMQRQLEKLRQHPQIVIGTPGRIHEIAAAGKLKLHHIRMLVIDEADQVFDLGSGKEVDKLLRGMVRDRQLAFFSATRPKEMEQVERDWMTEPKRIDVTAEAGTGQNVEHYFLVCDKRDKVDTARRLLRMLEPASALVFINDTEEIANYEAKFGYEGFTVETLYGDADKQRRAATLTRFRDGRCQLLLATDVAARGLDIADLPLVLHLDPAVDADHYVHRSGRTGRMGKSGTVVSIVTPQQLFIMDKFSKQLGIRIQQKSMYRGRLWDPEEVRNGRAGRHPGERGGARNGRGAGTEVRRESGEIPAAEGGRGGAGGRTAAGRSALRAAGKAGIAAAGKSSAGKPARDRERDKKDKGAPKWLKAKREEQRKP